MFKENCAILYIGDRFIYAHESGIHVLCAPILHTIYIPIYIDVNYTL